MSAAAMGRHAVRSRAPSGVAKKEGERASDGAVLVGKGRGRAEPAGAEEATRRELGWTSTRVGALHREGSKAQKTKKNIGRRGRRDVLDRTRERKRDALDRTGERKSGDVDVCVREKNAPLYPLGLGTWARICALVVYKSE